jgi:glycosyltransferase involved in cell wall biosynthesis
MPFGMRSSVTLMIPTLNEAVGMATIMPQIQRDWCDQILIVDGGSTDGTQEYARAHGYDLVVQRKPGIRHAYHEGFRHVRGDIVVTFSPDGNSIPQLIPELIREIDAGHDMVIASRYKDDARSYDDDLMTAAGNWMFTTLINRLHGGRYTDTMVIFRAYRTKLFWDLDLDRDDAYVTERLFNCVMGIEPLLSIRAAKKGLKVAEIPGDEPARIAGKRKLLPFRWGGAYLLQTLREVYFWKPGP